MKMAKASEFDQSFVTYERFLMMNSEDQKQIVLKMMEFMSSAEANSKIQEIVSSGTPEQKEKWKRVISFFSQMIISEAHAAQADKFSKYNSAVKGAKSNIDGSQQCIYAGWVSRTVRDPVKGITYCNHPANVKGSNSSSLTKYISSASCPTGPKDKQKIVCNPSLYGFKTGSTPLCADASPEMHNSSMQCMELALSGTPKEVDDRLKEIAENLAKNKELFKDLMSFVFFNCACDSKMGLEKANTDYRDYMRPHRTCYGLLNQLKAVLSRNECAVIEDEPNFKTMVGFLNKLQDELISSKGFSSSDDCQKKEDAGKPACNDKKDSNEKASCLSDLDRDKKNCLMVAKAKSLSQAADNKSGKSSGSTKNLPFDAEYGKVIDSIYEGDKDTQNFCAAYVSGKPTVVVTQPETTSGSQGGGDDDNKDDKSCKITCKLKEETAAPTVAAVQSTEPAGGKPVDKKEPPKKEEKKEEKKEVVYVCEKNEISKDQKGAEIVKNLSTFSVKTKAEASTDANLKHGDIECTIEGLPDDKKSDEEPSKDKYKATISEEKKDVSVTFTITVKDSAGKEPGTTITYSWRSSESKPEDKKPENKKPEDKKPEDKKPEDKKPEDSGKEIGKEKSITVPRSNKETKVCYTAKAGDDKEVENGTGCKTVPALEAAPAAGGGGNNFVPPQGARPRQQNIHINWGIK